MRDLREKLTEVANRVVESVVKKDTDYGSSWKKRGGVGAFMMMARKWDRIETQLEKEPHKWDVIEKTLNDSRPEGLVDDIDDLISYLLLVRSEIEERKRLSRIAREIFRDSTIRDARLSSSPSHGIDTSRIYSVDSGDPEAIARSRRERLEKFENK